VQKIIELEKNDDIISIRSRIEYILPELVRQSVQADGSTTRPRLLLVIPRGNQALKSLVNMKLLARTVASRAVDVAVVSQHPTVRDYGKEAGLRVFGSKWAARRAGWVTRETPVANAEATLPPAIESGDAPKLTRRQRRKKKKFVVVSGDHRSGSIKFLAQQLGLLILIVVLAFALVVGFIGLIPQATVSITPVAKSVETELVVFADPEADGVDFETLTFPARKTQVELRISGEIETVDTELSPVQRATGDVVFVNRTDQEHIIPMSTTVVSSSGEPVEFLTLFTATIPAGEGATTTPTLIIAAEAGPSGNKQVGQINRFGNPGLDRIVRVINERPTQGGALAPGRIVTEDDKPRLEAYLRQQIQQEGLAQLNAQLGEQEFIPPESVQVIVLDVKYREFSGDFSDVFGGEMQAVVRSTVIGGYNANRLALAALDAQVPTGYVLDVEGLKFGAGEVLELTDGVVSFVIFASGQAVPVIDERDVADSIAFLSVGEAQDLLSQQYDLATVPGVELAPAWVTEWLGRLPFSPLRINVVVNDAVTLMVDGS
jgi:hypothetical protein